MGLITFTCNNPTCKKRNQGKSVAKDQEESLKTVPNCPKCGKLMQPPEDKAAAATAPDPFASLANRVKKACGSNSVEHLYIRTVVDYLESAEGRKFQADFAAELKKDIDFGKFTRNDPKRLEDDKSVCFDSAMKNAGFALPKGCPSGEKYSFECPYLLQLAGWTHMAFCKAAPLLTTNFADFRAALEPNRQYLVQWTQNKGNTESHMICITVLADGTTGWIYDPQKLTMSYEGGFCEAWQNPEAGGEALPPKCRIDLTTGKQARNPKKHNEVIWT